MPFVRAEHPHRDRAGRRESAEQHEDLARLDDQQHTPHDLDRGDGEERAGERRKAAVVDHREDVQQRAAERTDGGDVADLAREDGLARGGVGSSRLGIRCGRRRIDGVEHPDCSIRVVHEVDTPRCGPRVQRVCAAYVQTVRRGRAPGG